jgi:xanthine dehydrogenase accessory factor
MWRLCLEKLEHHLHRSATALSKIRRQGKAFDAIETLRDNAFVLIMTQDHALDFELTQQALESKRFAYVGLIGSQGKSQRFRFRLKEQLSNVNLLDQLTCPIGNPDITGKLPMEVAVSVSAQLMERFKQHQANKQHNEMQPDVKQQNEEQWQQANLARKNIRENHQ